RDRNVTGVQTCALPILVIVNEDCGTTDGLLMTPIVEGGDIVEPLRDRVLGLVVAEDVYVPGTEEVLFEAGTLLDEAAVELLDEKGVDELIARSAITCENRHGLCAKCYGSAIGSGQLVNPCESVVGLSDHTISLSGKQ